ncbi:MAG: hypothetical protein WA182_21720 [Candidatus Sulfotelmatobacter sp.]
MSDPTLLAVQYNKNIPPEQKQRMVAHELGHFYQAKRCLGVNSDVTFGYHYVKPDDPVVERVLIRTAEGGAIAQSRTDGEAFNRRIQELESSGSLDFYTARMYWGCRILGGGEMEKALYGGESAGDSDDVQLMHGRLIEMGLTPHERKLFENEVREEIRSGLTPTIVQTARRAVVVIMHEHFNGQRTNGDVIHKILEGAYANND